MEKRAVCIPLNVAVTRSKSAFPVSILEYTEAGGIELGFRGFNNDEQKLNGTLTLDSKRSR